MSYYQPYKCNLKLSRGEFAELQSMLGKLEISNDFLSQRAIMEWAIARRIDYTRRLIEQRKEYSITLRAVDAYFLQTIITNHDAENEYQEMIVRKIMHAIQSKL